MVKKLSTHEEKKMKKPKSMTFAYDSWIGMRNRCLNPKHPSYKHYGGRGIKVCERWMDFEKFFMDMGERKAHQSLGRVDNNGNYERKNCRWEDDYQQMNNRRNSCFITMYEMTMTKEQWARAYGISPTTITNRLKRGWTVEQAIRTKPGEKRK